MRESAWAWAIAATEGSQEVGDADRAAETQGLGLGDTLANGIMRGEHCGYLSIAERRRREIGVAQRYQECGNQ
jgi:hypothetical protein